MPFHSSVPYKSTFETYSRTRPPRYRSSKHRHAFSFICTLQTYFRDILQDSTVPVLEAVIPPFLFIHLYPAKCTFETYSMTRPPRFRSSNTAFPFHSSSLAKCLIEPPLKVLLGIKKEHGSAQVSFSKCLMSMSQKSPLLF